MQAKHTSNKWTKATIINCCSRIHPCAYQPKLQQIWKIHHHYQIINRLDSDEVIPGLEFVLIELTDKFSPDTISALIGKGQSRAMRKMMVLWLRFMKETNERMSVLPAEMQKNMYISKAAALSKHIAYTPEELFNRHNRRIYRTVNRTNHQHPKRERIDIASFRIWRSYQSAFRYLVSCVADRTSDFNNPFFCKGAMFLPTPSSNIGS